MRPLFIPDYVETDLFPALRDTVAWVNRSSPRDECFMSMPGAPTVYSYGNSNEHRSNLHTYHAVPMLPQVKAVAERINADKGTTFNVCVLNYYKNEHRHLGWHSDDSPEQDLQHPICVVTFGASRYIWVREKGAKGEVPKEDRFLLTPGSLFWMPGGFQDTHQHRIPKHTAPCGGRISLTFRKLVR